MEKPETAFRGGEYTNLGRLVGLQKCENIEIHEEARELENQIQKIGKVCSVLVLVSFFLTGKVLFFSFILGFVCLLTAQIIAFHLLI